MNDILDIESRLAQWSFSFSLDAAPAEVVHVAKLCMADALGAAYAGSTTKTFVQCRRAPSFDGPCTVVGQRKTADAASAAYLNAVAAHVLDFDDTSYAGIVHGTAVVLPAALAVAQQIETSGSKLLEAFICGVEVEYALGLALTDNLYARGHWTTATLGIIGAAVAASKLLGLSASKIANAIRLAANIPLGLRATHGTTGKPYLCGMSARLGVETAFAAQAGIAGRPDTFGHPLGFIDTINGGEWSDEAFAFFGKRFSLLEPGIAFKLYPLCSATQAAIEATRAIRAEIGDDLTEIVSIRCRTTPLAAGCLPYLEPEVPAEAQFSMSFAIACVLVHGTVSIEHLSEDVLRDERLRVLMTRVEMVADESLVDEWAAAAAPEAASVEISLSNGRTHGRTVLAAEGMPQSPASVETLASKFVKCCALSMAEAEARSLWERILGVTEVAHAADVLPRTSQHWEE